MGLSELNRQHKQIDRNRAAIVKMLGERTARPLTEISSIEAGVDQHLYKDNLLEGEAIVDGDLHSKRDTKMVRSDKAVQQTYSSLLALAAQPEISEVLDTVLDELFSYEEGTNTFAELSQISINKLKIDDGIKKKIFTKLQESFDKVYTLHKFNDQSINKDYDFFKIAKLFLVLGKCRFFIEYDSLYNPTTVKAIHYLDPRLYSLERFEKKKGNRKINVYQITKINSTTSAQESYAHNGWNTAQSVTAELPALAIDAQIIDIDWSYLDITDSISYLSNMERAFNIYRTMERSRIAWAVNNSVMRTLVTIPTEGLGYRKSLMTLRKAMHQYSESYSFDDNNGNVTVNGKPSSFTNKQMWMIQSAAGKPEFENIDGSGVEIQDMEAVMYFWQRFIRSTKCPPTLLDKENQNNWTNDEHSMTLEYQRFHKWLTRIKRALNPIFVKPIWADFILNPDNESYKGDDSIRQNIYIHWHSNDVFRKQLELAEMSKTVTTINEMVQMTHNEELGIPILSTTMLIKKFLNMSDEELKEHEEQIIKDNKRALEIAKEIAPPEENDDDDYSGGRF